jgi:hypothetical protein
MSAASQPQAGSIPSPPPPAVKTGRDRAVDILRGLAILSMVCGHVGGPTWLNHSTRFFHFMDGSSGFVMLSGFILGVVTTIRIERTGVKKAYQKIWMRCLQIYLLHIALTLGMTAVGAATGRIRSIPPLEQYGGPLSVAWAILALRWQPTLMDILPMYVGFLSLAPAVIAGVRKGLALPIVLVSGIIYTAVQLSPSTFERGYTLPGLGRGFQFFAWQFIFCTGLVAGYLRADRWLAVPSPARNRLVNLSTALLLVLTIVSQLQRDQFPSLHWVGKDWERRLFSEYLHAPLLTLYLFTAEISGYVFFRWLAARFPKAFLLQFFETLGKNSLFLFVTHLFFVFGHFALKAPKWPFPAREVSLALTVVVLYLLAANRERLKTFVLRPFRGAGRPDSAGEASQQPG